MFFSGTHSGIEDQQRDQFAVVVPRGRLDFLPVHPHGSELTVVNFVNSGTMHTSHDAHHEKTIDFVLDSQSQIQQDVHFECFCPLSHQLKSEPRPSAAYVCSAL